MDNTGMLLLLLIGFPVAFLAIWSLVLFLLSRISGWNRLAATYGRAGDEPPRDGHKYFWQSGSIGIIGYRHSLHIGVHEQGLSLEVAWPLSIGHQRLFIPWTALHDRQDVKVFWRSMTRVQVGRPIQGRLLLPAKVFESLPP